jgi:hypothetical protein
VTTPDPKALAQRAAAKAHVAKNATLASDPVSSRLFETLELLASAVAALSDRVGPSRPQRPGGPPPNDLG